MSEKTGWYCIGGKMGFCIHLDKRPNIFHRVMMKLLLNIEWFDEKIKQNIPRVAG